MKPVYLDELRRKADFIPTRLEIRILKQKMGILRTKYAKKYEIRLKNEGFLTESGEITGDGIQLLQRISEHKNGHQLHESIMKVLENGE